MNDERKPTDDAQLGITSAEKLEKLGITRRWSCGCAVVVDHGRAIEQPSLTCDGVVGHKLRELTLRPKRQERDEGPQVQGSLFPREDEDDEKC